MMNNVKHVSQHEHRPHTVLVAPCIGVFGI